MTAVEPQYDKHYFNRPLNATVKFLKHFESEFT